MVLNPNSKLLAVAGAFQVAVVVLPRAGFTKLVPSIIDCKCVRTKFSQWLSIDICVPFVCAGRYKLGNFIMLQTRLRPLLRSTGIHGERGARRFW